MMGKDDNKIIDAEFEQLANSIKGEYYTIDELEKELKINKGKILYYCNKFKELLKIDTVNEYMMFDTVGKDYLALIKKLNIEEGKSISEIKKEIEEKRIKVIIREEENKELSLINNFSQLIAKQNLVIEEQNERMANIEMLVEKLVMALINNSEGIENIKKEIIKTEKKIDKKIEVRYADIERKIAKKDSEIIEEIRQHMQVKKNNKKHWFKNIFKRK